MKRTYLLVFSLLYGWQVSATVLADPFVPGFEEISPGVWVGIRDISPRFPVMGNTTFVVSEDGVVVFDGGGVSLMSERIIDKIRSVTDKPVTHIVVSHWHGDHNFGIHRFLEEFPNVQVVGHSFTREAMLGGPMEYAARYPQYMANNRENFQKTIDTGLDDEGIKLVAAEIDQYRLLMESFDLIDAEFGRVKVTPPTVVFDDKLVIYSGSRKIELLYLGDANTAGDILMWLPEERIVSSGDVVVFPTPYGFNMPPKAWSDTLRNLKALEYEILVPGHGSVQRGTEYLDLLIESAGSIVAQRDKFVAHGIDKDKAMEMFDFTDVEQRFTGGDELLISRFKIWYTDPLRAAAYKELSGVDMVSTAPRKPESEEE